MDKLTGRYFKFFIELKEFLFFFLAHRKTIKRRKLKIFHSAIRHDVELVLFLPFLRLNQCL